MKHITVLFIFLITVCSAGAQRACETVAYSKTVQPVNSLTGNLQTFLARDTTPGEIIVIPVVVHVLYKQAGENISTSQVLSQIKILNDDYRRRNADTSMTPLAFRPVAADAGITFCLAQVDPNGRPTSGIIRKPTNQDMFTMNDEMKFSATGGDNAWDPTRYLNIWVCNMSTRNLGYASLPQGPADKDGIVLNHTAFGNTGTARIPFDKGRTATHEIAHWLGLMHLWGDNTCASDGIDDTPTQESYNFYCPAYPHMSSCSPDARGDMFMNFMDFTDDACMNLFTTGQKNKMRSQFALHMPRNSFLQSYACDSSLASGAPLVDSVIPKKPVFEWQVYPNPVRDFLQVQKTDKSSLQGWVASVYNMRGVLMGRHSLQQEKFLVYLKHLTPGIYMLRLENGTDKYSMKFLKTD